MKRFLLLVLISVFALFLIGCDNSEETPTPHEHVTVVHEGKAATCTEPGWTEYKTCSGCDIYSTYTPIAPLGHSYSETYVAQGEVHTKSCTRCSDTVALAHSWGTPAVTEPTCTVPGANVYTCADCGATKSETVSSLGHSYSDTCTADGEVHTKSCTRCSDTVALAHSWGTPAVTEPTCTVPGANVYTCADCGATKSETVSLLGHDFSETVLDGGQQALACSRCSTTVDVHTHDWRSFGLIVAPTCTRGGEEELVCTVCSTKKTVELPALAHVLSDEYAQNGDVHSIFCITCSTALVDHPHYWESAGVIKAPTCDLTGTELFVCTVCHAEKTETLPESHPGTGWVVNTPATAFVEGERALKCTSCHKQFKVERIAPDVESMDRVYLTGNYEGAYVNGKKQEVGMTVTYVYADGTSFDSYATIKAQGATSISYPKKNYTIKFYKDAAHDSKNKIDLGWGKQNKYVMKANWVDYSQSRNVMSCRLWGDIVQTRATSSNQQKLAALTTNGGAIDGYPIAVYMNGSFHGLYTMNVPKEDWMFGMGEKDENGNKSTTEALLATDDWNHTDFYSTIGEFYENSEGDIVAKNGGWELVYHGGDDYNWVAESFDALITFCQNNDGQAFRDGIREHLDVESAIDYLIYMYANCMHDNASKNMLWATYDGKTWIASVYDQDGSFGQVWDGVRFSLPSSSLPSVKSGRVDVGINYGPSGGNNPKFILWDRIWNNFTAEVLARYDELRATVLSTDYMIAEYKKFEAMIPESMFEAELEVWADERASWWAGKGKTGPYDYTAYHYDYIYTWIADRMSNYDSAISNIKSYYGY